MPNRLALAGAVFIAIAALLVDALVWAFSELLVEPMKSEGIFEVYRRNAEAAEQCDKPQPTQTTWAIGSMEWLAEQKKSR